MTGKHTGASMKIFDYMRQYPNQVIPQAEICRALGYPDYTVSNSVTHLIAKGMPISRPVAGTALYTPGPQKPDAPTAPETAPLYEYIGMTAGKTLVRDEDKELYVLVPLNVFIQKEGL